MPDKDGPLDYAENAVTALCWDIEALVYLRSSFREGNRNLYDLESLNRTLTRLEAKLRVLAALHGKGVKRHA